MKTQIITENRKVGATVSWVLRAIAVTLVAMATMLVTIAPSVALADITTGDTTIHGYTPDEVVSTDIEVAGGGLEGLGPFLADKVKRMVILALPVLAVASVAVLIYNAVRNMFLPDEDPHEARRAGRKPKRPMGQVIKDIFMMFFWILFAWIIVELIIYAVTHLETVAQQSLTSSSGQQTTTQQVSQQSQSSQSGGQATPVGGSSATPVGSGSAPATTVASDPAPAGQAEAPAADGVVADGTVG